jgi:glucosylceramidase
MDDRTILLQQQTPIAFSTTNAYNNPLVVDETQLYQQIEGFGASFTDTTGYILNEVAAPAARTNAMNNLFTRAGGGIGLSFVRNPMGASDLARYHYSYDDNPPGGSDTNLDFFSIAHDEADIIPLLQQALQLNPQLKIMANPWSPPGWMKTSGSMIGGSNLPSMFAPFANYFVKYVQAYQAHGIPIHYLSLQNEPLYIPGDYPGMYMNAATQTVLLRDYVLPALASNQIATKILVYDHNWDRPDYPTTIFSDASLLSSTQIAGTAWHGYGGTPGAMLTLANKYPSKGNYETEHTGVSTASDQLRSDFKEITHVMRSWGKSYVKWNMAGNLNDGPHAGGCGTCTPLVYVNTNSGAVSYSIDFYTLGHFSKFVLPGAYRIFSGNAAGIISAAFLNTDGSKALVAFNDTSTSRNFRVQWGTQSFSYTLPGYAGATFTWMGAQNGSYSINASNQIQASAFNSVSSLQTEPTSDSLGGYDLGYANTGGYAVYQNVDLAYGFTDVTARVASAGSGGSVEFHLDSSTGPFAGSVPVPITGGWQTWQTVTGSVTGGTGPHNLHALFKGGSGIGNLNWFQFSGALPPLPIPWLTADIGGVGIAGIATYSNTTFTVSGSGSDIEGTSDAFRYVYQSCSGDSELRARVTTMGNTDPWAKAGIMFRDSTAANAINVSLFLTASNGVEVQRRTTTGGITASTVVSGLGAPRWLRLTRAGNSFNGCHSSDGATWIQIAAGISVSIGSNALAGLAVTAHNNSTNCVATFDDVTLNQAPLLAAISNQTIIAGNTLLVTNSASDADIPAQALFFSLANAPSGASIDTNSGLFAWRPAISQSPSTQMITTVVSDTGTPSLSATKKFLVTVMQPAKPLLVSSLNSNRQFNLTVNGDTGPDYTLLSSSNLLIWAPIWTTNSPALPFTWIETNSPGFPWRFYRIILGP